MEKNANVEIQSSHDDIRRARQLGPIASAANAVPRADYGLAQLSDADLLANTRRLVGRSNQLFAALLAHLAEVEARGVHRTRACSSLYTYCIYELRMSEDAAFRRATAAKLVKRFPALFDAIASGELHLTGLLMLGQHLPAANLVEVLARAKHRTKKEIAELVRALNPLPDVPPRIEPLGPAPATPARDATANAKPGWQDFVESMVPVRELRPGDRPRDWTDGSLPSEGSDVTSRHLRSCSNTRQRDAPLRNRQQNQRNQPNQIV